MAALYLGNITATHGLLSLTRAGREGPKIVVSLAGWLDVLVRYQGSIWLVRMDFRKLLRGGWW